MVQGGDVELDEEAGIVLGIEGRNKELRALGITKLLEVTYTPASVDSGSVSLNVDDSVLE